MSTTTRMFPRREELGAPAYPHRRYAWAPGISPRVRGSKEGYGMTYTHRRAVERLTARRAARNHREIQRGILDGALGAFALAQLALLVFAGAALWSL